MGTTGRIIGVAAGAAAAGAAARLVQQRNKIAHRDLGDHTPFGSLHSAPITVVADDGVRLHAELEEADPPKAPRPGRLGRRVVEEASAPGITVVFVHGYSLSLDCWHFQRAGYRGLVRTAYYDQRSHGQSQKSSIDHSTIEQLGRDLVRVIDDLSGDDRVVLVGHSMGGMTILSLAEERPDLFGTKVVGAALISTTAGGLDPGRILFPMVPAGLGAGVVGRVVSALSRGHRGVDLLRRYAHDLAGVVVDQYAFGSDVPKSYVDFVYDMLDATPFSVVADFFPAFAALDKWAHLEPLSRIPVAIVCGTDDKITGIGHSRKLHARIHGSDLLECQGAGHMVIIERHAEVNDELDELIDHAIDFAERHPWAPDHAGPARSAAGS